MFRHARFSVDRERLKPLAQFQSEHAGRHIARFLAGHCRTAGFDAVPDPIESNAAHALVTFDGTPGELRRAARRPRDEFVELITGLDG